MTDGHSIDRDRLQAGVVECPLCERQIPEPVTHAVVYGAVDTVTADNAEAVECPVCDGVTFVAD
ncbi:hypothetical protein Har1130_04180 [Haloarcula sp. CBA1130]|uniref:hypothetical protein n=1 Tax=unclassified Haloarcula TaxID=2624677 RepID=UPI00124884C9|nr:MULTISPECIES: hypothetical protein [unclassified Haloarcula]KAA9398423.1 hypothetical protein Har1129_09480 [Haloarcula sp. CBA1129]KAA9401984.1 hypothetical protein Har1130_04180 [Haloarcula sp. CBA1130]